MKFTTSGTEYFSRIPGRKGKWPVKNSDSAGEAVSWRNCRQVMFCRWRRSHLHVTLETSIFSGTCNYACRALSSACSWFDPSMCPGCLKLKDDAHPCLVSVSSGGMRPLDRNWFDRTLKVQ